MKNLFEKKVKILTLSKRIDEAKNWDHGDENKEISGYVWWGANFWIAKPRQQVIRVRAWTIQKRRGRIVLDEEERKGREEGGE